MGDHPATDRGTWRGRTCGDGMPRSPMERYHAGGGVKPEVQRNIFHDAQSHWLSNRMAAPYSSPSMQRRMMAALSRTSSSEITSGGDMRKAVSQ